MGQTAMAYCNNLEIGSPNLNSTASQNPKCKAEPLQHPDRPELRGTMIDWHAWNWSVITLNLLTRCITRWKIWSLA